MTARRLGSGDALLGLIVGAGAASVLVASYRSTPYDQLIEAVAAAWGLDPDLLRAIGRKESAFRTLPPSKNANGTTDHGIWRINSATAKAYGIALDALENPEVNAHAAARLLNDLRRELGSVFSLHTWIAAYNAGSPAIKRRGIFNYGYMAETWTHYVMYKLAGVFR